jgi:hypothetical protein
VHTYEVLAARKIIITKAGLKELTQRLKIYMVKRVKK